jgi:hypothetical protein
VLCGTVVLGGTARARSGLSATVVLRVPLWAVCWGKLIPRSGSRRKEVEGAASSCHLELECREGRGLVGVGVGVDSIQLL